jgi:hypothetical protein
MKLLQAARKGKVSYTFTAKSLCEEANKKLLEYSQEKPNFKAKIMMKGLGIKEERKILSKEPLVVQTRMTFTGASYLSFSGLGGIIKFKELVETKFGVWMKPRKLDEMLEIIYIE